MIDKEQIFDLIDQEKQRQEDELCLIASENYMSEDVLKADGSVLVNKYTEGYVPDSDGNYRRYYGGCHVIDKIERAAIDNACELFKCKYANVQPNSGCQANQAVYMALCNPGDTILSMCVDEGGHISHSLKIGFAGTFYNIALYGINREELLNYDDIKEKLYMYNPHLLLVGASAYPREIDFKRIRDIVNEYNEVIDVINNVIETDGKYEFTFGDETKKTITKPCEKCYLMVDMAHIAGLVAVGEHMSPIPYADVVTSTVQKTLRSGRGGIILTNDEEIAKKVDKAIFPRLQGGALQNMIAGKAIGFAEALKPEFKEYIIQVKKNIKAMEEIFHKEGTKLVSNGSDNHLLLIDLKDTQVTGAQLEKTLETLGIVTNKNAVKHDPRPKMETSGLRIGTAAMTTRGGNEDDARLIAHIIASTIIYLDEYGAIPDKWFNEYKNWVKNWCKDHPIYKK